MVKTLTKHGIMPILAPIFKLLLLIVTSINTYSFLLDASHGNRLWSIVGLVVFEGALMYWWLAFRHENEPSIMQLGVSLVMFIGNLLLVLAASAFHLSAVDPSLLGPSTISKVVIVAIAVNLAAAMIYPLMSMEETKKVVRNATSGIIWGKALTNLLHDTDELSEQLTAELKAEQWSSIENSIRRSASLSAPTVIEHPAEPTPRPVGDVYSVVYPNGRTEA